MASAVQNTTQESNKPKSGKGSRAGTRPEYAVAAVDAFPEEAPSLRGKQDTYVTLLQPIVDAGKPDQWYEIASFKTPTGAHGACDALEAGERKLPSAKGSWEFKAIKVVDPENPDGKRHSKLFARFAPSGK